MYMGEQSARLKVLVEKVCRLQDSTHQIKNQKWSVAVARTKPYPIGKSNQSLGRISRRVDSSGSSTRGDFSDSKCKRAQT